MTGFPQNISNSTKDGDSAQESVFSDTLYGIYVVLIKKGEHCLSQNCNFTASPYCQSLHIPFPY